MTCGVGARRSRGRRAANVWGVHRTDGDHHSARHQPRPPAPPRAAGHRGPAVAETAPTAAAAAARRADNERAKRGAVHRCTVHVRGASEGESKGGRGGEGDNGRRGNGTLPRKAGRPPVWRPRRVTPLGNTPWAVPLAVKRRRRESRGGWPRRLAQLPSNAFRDGHNAWGAGVRAVGTGAENRASGPCLVSTPPRRSPLDGPGMGMRQPPYCGGRPHWLVQRLCPRARAANGRVPTRRLRSGRCPEDG